MSNGKEITKEAANYPYDPKLSYYQNLLRFVMNGKKTAEDIVGYLSMLDSVCVAMIGKYKGDLNKIPEETQDDMADFYDEFMYEFGEITKEERMENWGENDALILNIGAAIAEKQRIEDRDETIMSLTPEERKECDDFVEMIFRLPGDKTITYSYGSINGEEEDMEHTIPSIQNMALYDDLDPEEIRKEIIYGVSHIITCYCGSAVIRAFDSNDPGEATLYSVRALNGEWEPVDKEELEDAYTMTPSGYRVAPEKGLTFGSLPPRDGKKPIEKHVEKKDPKSIFRVIK